jgi:putative GTP pyrophosphokinase
MNNIFTLFSSGRSIEASNFRNQLNKLISEGETYELDKLLEATEKSIKMYK